MWTTEKLDQTTLIPTAIPITITVAIIPIPQTIMIIVIEQGYMVIWYTVRLNGYKCTRL